MLGAQSLQAQWIQTNGPYGGFITSFAVSGTNLFAGTNEDFSGGVFLSTNNGTSWTAVNTGLTDTNVNALAVSGTNLFAGTDDGVFLSTNNGTSWTAVNTGLTDTNVNALAVSGTNLFAGTFGGTFSSVFLSTNNGTSWTAINATYPAPISAMLWNSTGDFFIATRGAGIYRNGVQINTGLTNTFVSALAVSGTNLFAGTDGSGVWRRPLSEMVTAVEDDFRQAPVGFTLEQNYPNPFWSGATSRSAGNPSTIIRYQLPKSTQVVLKIYNLSGQEVRTLVNERQPAGMNSVVWDGRDQSGKEVSSGIYLYRLQAGESVQSHKLSFVR